MAEMDTSPDGLAESFQVLVEVSKRFTRDLALICDSPAPTSTATVRRLTDLLAVLGPASEHRDRLAQLSPQELRAGIVRWSQTNGHMDGTGGDR